MNEIKKEESAVVTLKESITFSSAIISDVVSYQVFTFLIFTFYFTIVRLNIILISIGFVIWSIWNAANDPLLGMLSDRTHSRWGRRIPWIMASTIPLGLIMIFLFTPPVVIGITDEMSNFVYFIIVIIVFELFYTMFDINATSLFPEIFIAKEERAKVNSVRQIFVVIGLIVSFILPTLFIPDFTDRKYLPNYWTFGIAICIVIIIFGLIFLKWGAKEKAEFKEDYKNQPRMLDSFIICIKNKNFRWAAFGHIMVFFVFGMLPTIIPLYGKFVLGIENSLFIALLLAVAFLSAMFFVIVWQILVVKIGPRKTWICTLVVWIMAQIPLFFITGVLWGLIIFALIGSGLAGSLFLREIIYGDIIDEDELKTGVRREAAYYGMNALFMRLSTILVFFAIGLVFTNVGWTVYTPERVTSEVIFGLKLLMVVFPIVALLLAIFSFYMYSLDGERLEKVKEDQLKLHSEKKSKI